jgi:hypothetical protein
VQNNHFTLLCHELLFNLDLIRTILHSVLYAWRGVQCLQLTIVLTVALELVSSTETTSVALPHADSIAVVIVETRPLKVGAQTVAT